MVIWIIGLSSSGKSKIAGLVYKRLKKKKINTVWLDGDNVRNIYNDKLGYTLKDREKNAQRISKLTKYFSDQNIQRH